MKSATVILYNFGRKPKPETEFLVTQLKSLNFSVSLRTPGKLNPAPWVNSHCDIVLHWLSKVGQAPNDIAVHKPQAKLYSERAKNICLLSPAHSQALPEGIDKQFDEVIFWPCSKSELEFRLNRNSVNNTRSSSEPQRLQRLTTLFEPFKLLGSSSAFLQTLEMIEAIAKVDAPTLICGETGTGKENTARAIHYLGIRQQSAFIPINCATLSDELFESELFGHTQGAFTGAKEAKAGLVEIAQGGTLFLDEIDSLSLKAQASLLRFLQTQEFRSVGSNTINHANTRIIAASNIDFKQALKKDKFRADLYFRLNVLNISLPPLRDRPADIAIIAKSLIDRFAIEYNCKKIPITPQFNNWLVQHTWPGNVRELENVILRKMLLGPIEDYATGQDAGQFNLSITLGSERDFQAAKKNIIQAFEKRFLEEILTITEGNISEASRICGKERRAIGKMLKNHNIDRQQFFLE